MKKLSFIVMLACLGFFAASCSDDDKPDPAPEKDYAKEIASTYVGDLSVELPAGEGGLIEDKSSIDIIAATPNKVNLVLENFVINIGGTPLNVGTIKLTDVEVEGKDGAVNIKEKEFKDYSLENLPIKATIVVKSGTVKGDNLSNLVLHINDVFAPHSIIVKFAGVKNNKKGEAAITEVKVEKHDAIVGDAVLDAKANVIAVELKKDATFADLKEVVFTFKTSDKAVATPASGSKIDLTSGSAEIKVVAENGLKTTTYKVVANLYKYNFKYDMEEWVVEVEEGDDGFGNILKELYAPAGGWGTTNLGIRLIDAMVPAFDPTSPFKPVGSNVSKTEDAHTGKAAAKLVTIDSEGVEIVIPGFPNIPKVTSASLFLGNFDVDTQNTLNSTKFGVPFKNQAIAVKGYYKYTPGKIFYRGTPENSHLPIEEKGTIDKCAINAFLYEIKDDKDLPITGVDTYKDPRIVAHASFESDGAKEYTAFNLELKYTKEYDKSKKYRFAIVASSSSQGDTFSGAPGSTLYLDDIEIIAE